MHPDAWNEVKEAVWTASALAQEESEDQARQAMEAWMARVRERTESEFIPWYTNYWTQQWIGLKAGWYEMNRDDEEAQVEDYLVVYLQTRYHELVLEPAGVESDPQTISRQAASSYVRLLAEQLARLPKTHEVSRRSLQRKLQHIPLIAVRDTQAADVTLSTLLERDRLDGIAAYDGLFDIGAPKDEGAALDDERLRGVAQDSVARMVAELPVRGGGSAAAMIVGEAIGLIISAGVAAWSALAHEQEKPEIESQLRQALEAGMEKMWHILMEDPELGVLYPVRRMSTQLEAALFPAIGPEPGLPF